MMVHRASGTSGPDMTARTRPDRFRYALLVARTLSGTGTMNNESKPDLREKWEVRLERVRRSQARSDVAGMTRPPRDPVEREFLQRIGREGPFTESPKPQVGGR
jgi:hypothetical protein